MRDHLVAPRVSLDDGRIVEEPRERTGLERRRHDQHAQVLAERLLAFETKREAEIGVEAPLVKFIENHAADVLERRVGLQHAGQDSLGDDFDPGGAAHSRLEPGADADGLTHPLADEMRHSLGHCTRRNAARLEH